MDGYDRRRMHVRYIGSKRSLLPQLDDVFSRYLGPNDIFADLFAGTGVVAKFVQTKYKCTVVANDVLYFSHLLNTAKLSRYTEEERKEVAEGLHRLNALPPMKVGKGFCSREYAPPARMYFTQDNACKIDRMRVEAESYAPKIRAYLIASILVAADKVANTCAVYGAYLKQFKPSALKPIVLEEQLQMTDESDCCFPEPLVYNGDVLQLLVYNKTLRCTPTVVYLDPPYNIRQYSTNYHVLETLAKYDNPKVKGITGLRGNEARSPFAARKGADDAYSYLATLLRDVPVVILSYNDEGLFTGKEMKEMWEAYGRHVEVIQIPYKRLRLQPIHPANQHLEEKRVQECIFVCTKPCSDDAF